MAENAELWLGEYLRWPHGLGHAHYISSSIFTGHLDSKISKMVNFKYLVRTQDDEGQARYAEASAEVVRSDLVGLSLTTYEGGEPWDVDFRLTEKKAKVSRV
jgi:hypothetical protein